jgi:hypothetical protein
MPLRFAIAPERIPSCLNSISLASSSLFELSSSEISGRMAGLIVMQVLAEQADYHELL